MEFTNTFTVPTDVATTFAVLTDLERVAPCLPGASLESVEGEVHTGRVRVKVGPISMDYHGTARLTEADAVNHRARIEASGREARGGGTARADVTATLAADPGGTLVTVVTDLVISGRAAQFGRGAMAEVGTRIIDQFAERLHAMLEAGRPGGAPSPAGATAGHAPRATQRDESRPASAAGGEGRATADDALDLVGVAGAAAAKRLVPLLVAIVVVAGAIWWVVSR